MTAKEVANRVHHCSNRPTTERVIQSAMDEAANEALERAGNIVIEELLNHIGVSITGRITVAVAMRVQALKTPKPSVESAVGKSGGVG